MHSIEMIVKIFLICVSFIIAVKILIQFILVGLKKNTLPNSSGGDFLSLR